MALKVDKRQELLAEKSSKAYFSTSTLVLVRVLKCAPTGRYMFLETQEYINIES